MIGVTAMAREVAEIPEAAARLAAPDAQAALAEAGFVLYGLDGPAGRAEMPRDRDPPSGPRHGLGPVPVQRDPHPQRRRAAQARQAHPV
ncbi:MAG: hypothetical protein ACU0CO_13965, partial [Shimia sp.]